jgi:multiple sugar transport system permease protein
MAQQAQTLTVPVTRQAGGAPAWLITLGMILRYIVLFGFAILFLAPFIFAIANSLKTAPQIAQDALSLIPNPFTLDNYIRLTQGAANVPLWTLNSIIFAGAVTIARVFLCSLAGYALARVNFPGRNVVFLAVLATMMIPGVVLLIPRFIILKQLGLLATYPGGILPIAVDAFGIFLMKQFFETIPSEVEEAARIDGATPFEIFSRVAFPMATAPLIALTIFAFQGTWNELQHFLIALGPTARDLWPLTLGLATLRGAGVGQQLDFGLFLAGSILMTLPMALVFIVFQRYFVESSSHSAVKG